MACLRLKGWSRSTRQASCSQWLLRQQRINSAAAGPAACTAAGRDPDKQDRSAGRVRLPSERQNVDFSFFRRQKLEAAQSSQPEALISLVQPLRTRPIQPTFHDSVKAMLAVRSCRSRRDESAPGFRVRQPVKKGVELVVVGIVMLRIDMPDKRLTRPDGANQRIFTAH